ncbi:MAG TPA: M48 family metalloprotease [Patescibacteria group bacterium]|nr:M48 family metalloprotease [Patescibacteria group bacterium]
MRTRLLTAIIAFVLSAPFAFAQNVELPDMGSSAGSVLSPEQEARYGARMLYELRRIDMVLDDALIDDYVHALGYRLVALSERPEQAFTFFVVRSNDINAFAAPGGYVGINVGLMHTAESESEVAAVLAHEVAHVTQRHLVRAYESMQKATLPIALAMLGAVLASRNSSGDGTEAAIIGGMGLLQQQAINFTRHNEYEADRIGIFTLAKAGFDAEAMAGFFARMGRATRSNNSVEMPEFLRTHPVTASRITEAKNRVEAIRRNPPAVAESAANEARFRLMRERAHVLTATEPAKLVDTYRGELRHAAEDRAPSLRYGMALSMLRSGQAKAAMAELDRLLVDAPNDIAFLIPRAQAQRMAGDGAGALERLKALGDIAPDHRAVQLAYAEALNAVGDKTNGQRAMSVLRPILAKHGADPTTQAIFARACELAGEEARALEAHAEVALYTGRPYDAMEQLKRLLERPGVDYYQRARVEARVEELKPYMAELERQRVRKDDQDNRRL